MKNVKCAQSKNRLQRSYISHRSSPTLVKYSLIQTPGLAPNHVLCPTKIDNDYISFGRSALWLCCVASKSTGPFYRRPAHRQNLLNVDGRNDQRQKFRSPSETISPPTTGWLIIIQLHVSNRIRMINRHDSRDSRTSAVFHHHSRLYGRRRRWKMSNHVYIHAHFPTVISRESAVY